MINKFSLASILVLSIIVLGISVSVLWAQDGADIEDRNRELARRAVEDIWAGEDLDSADELFSFPLLIWTQESPARFNDVGLFKEYHRRVSQNTWGGTLQLTVDDVLVSDEMAAVHYTAQGTFTGGWNLPLIVGGVAPASGEEETWQGVFLYRIEDGKIAEEWWYWNRELNDILGLVPGG